MDISLLQCVAVCGFVVSMWKSQGNLVFVSKSGDRSPPIDKPDSGGFVRTHARTLAAACARAGERWPVTRVLCVRNYRDKTLYCTHLMIGVPIVG